MKYEDLIEVLKNRKVEILNHLLTEHGKTLKDFETDNLGLFLIKLGNDLIMIELDSEPDIFLYFLKREAVETITEAKKVFRVEKEFGRHLRDSKNERRFDNLSKDEIERFHNSLRYIYSLIINNNYIISPIFLNAADVDSLLEATIPVQTIKNPFIKRITLKDEVTVFTQLYDLIETTAERSVWKVEDKALVEDLKNRGIEMMKKIVSTFDPGKNASLTIYFNIKLKHYFTNTLFLKTGHFEIDDKGKKVFVITPLVPMETESSSSSNSDGTTSLIDRISAKEKDDSSKLDDEIKPMLKDLEKAIKALSSENQKTAILAVIEGITQKEAAANLQRNLNTFKADVRRGKLMIAEYLRKKGWKADHKLVRDALKTLSEREVDIDRIVGTEDKK